MRGRGRPNPKKVTMGKKMDWETRARSLDMQTHDDTVKWLAYCSSDPPIPEAWEGGLAKRRSCDWLPASSSRIQAHYTNFHGASGSDPVVPAFSRGQNEIYKLLIGQSMNVGMHGSSRYTERKSPEPFFSWHDSIGNHEGISHIYRCFKRSDNFLKRQLISYQSPS